MKVSALYLLLVLLFFPSEHNCQTIEAEIQNLSEGADLIVTGKVLEQKAQWNADKTMIFTFVTVNVEEYLKGTAAGNKLTITHQGGEVGSVGEYYTHIPTFEENEEVLLFVKKHNADQSYRVLEGESGKLRLQTDKATGEKMTSRNISLSELRKEILKNVRQ